MDNWHHFRVNLQRATGCLALLTNSLLITLITLFSPKAFGSYRYLMIFLSVFELAYSFIDVLLGPEVITKGTYWFCLMNSTHSFLPFSVKYFLLVCWASAFGVSMGNFVVHIVYRYLVITGNKKWTSSGGLRICIWMSASLVYGVVWGLVSHYFEMRTAQSDAYFEANVEQFKGVPVQSVVYFGFSFYKMSNGKEVMNWFAITGLLLLATLISISLVLMTYFGTKCYLSIRELADKTQKSSKAKRIQSQLFFSLVLQTSIPMILMHIPCGLVALSSMLKITDEIYGNLLTTSIALFPAIDPLPSVLIIQPYRTAVIKCALWIFRVNKRKIECQQVSTATLELRGI